MALGIDPHQAYVGRLQPGMASISSRRSTRTEVVYHFDSP